MLNSGKFRGNDIVLMSLSISSTSFPVFPSHTDFLPLSAGIFPLARYLLSLRIFCSPTPPQNCPVSRLKVFQPQESFT